MHVIANSVIVIRVDILGLLFCKIAAIFGKPQQSFYGKAFFD